LAAGSRTRTGGLPAMRAAAREPRRAGRAIGKIQFCNRSETALKQFYNSVTAVLQQFYSSSAKPDYIYMAMQ
jgi:hypothetical protein